MKDNRHKPNKYLIFLLLLHKFEAAVPVKKEVRIVIHP